MTRSYFARSFASARVSGLPARPGGRPVAGSRGRYMPPALWLELCGMLIVWQPADSSQFLASQSCRRQSSSRLVAVCAVMSRSLATCGTSFGRLRPLK